MTTIKKDSEPTLAQLQEMICDFTYAHGWNNYHSGRTLSTSVAIEAAELLEHFQWIEPGPEKYEEIRLEAADILIYLLQFCKHKDIDLAQAVQDKMAINATRWPLEEK